MSYGVAAALQEAVYAHLQGDATLTALIGDAIFDAEPSGTLPTLYVTLGPETVRMKSDVSGSGAQHEFEIGVVTENAGFQAAKEVAAAISDALSGADLVLSRGSLVNIWFYRASAARDEVGTLRRVSLTFRARVDDT